MIKERTITLCKGGTKERTMPISQLSVPDAWHAIQRVEDEDDREILLDVWHLAHSLREYVQAL